MVELVMTMIIVGVLAAVAIPRFANVTSYNARGVADQTLSAIQFARKVAIATRRNVCVSTAGNGVSLTMATLAGSASTCGTTAVINPATGNAYTIAAVTGVTIISVSIQFDGQGRPAAASSIAVAGDGMNYTITLMAVTGHAYAL